ncbi:hypothetical protein [Lacrimispora sp. 38-1]|uniref:hypothetical protein n=1 Tax=Lacrimispora sp. 38-1 TaxID=3125778 RepID=UPI003CF11FB9
MLIEETSFLSQILEYRYLSEKSYAVINENPLKDTKQIEEADSKVLSLCAPDIQMKINYDERIVKALFEIDSYESIDNHTISKLCSAVHLSQSRLSHLFRDQVKTYSSILYFQLYLSLITPFKSHHLLNILMTWNIIGSKVIPSLKYKLVFANHYTTNKRIRP